MSERLTHETVELLQSMIRNRCVNDGTAESGFETRNSDLLESFLGSTGLEIEQFEPVPGRASIVARIEGTDPDVPSSRFVVDGPRADLEHQITGPDRAADCAVVGPVAAAVVHHPGVPIGH